MTKHAPNYFSGAHLPVDFLPSPRGRSGGATVHGVGVFQVFRRDVLCENLEGDMSCACVALVANVCTSADKNALARARGFLRLIPAGNPTA